MNRNDEGTVISIRKRTIHGEKVSHVMEAMPLPKGWDMEQQPAKGRGNLRLVRGKIPFVRLSLSLADRMAPVEEDGPAPLSMVDFDPADSVLKRNQKRKVRSRGGSIDLFDLERRIKSDRSIDSGRYSGSEPRKLAAARYRSRREAEKIRADLGSLVKRLKFNLFEISFIFVFLAVTELLPAFGLSLSGIRTPEGNTLIYPVISLIGLGFAAAISFRDMKEGVRDLFTGRFSTLTSVSAAVLAELIHIVYIIAAALFFDAPIPGNSAAPVCLAVLVYTVNRLVHTSRVERGFTYASKKGIHSAVISADDSPIAADLRYASGSRSARIVYLVRTRHLSNYFTNACREDKCSVLVSRVYPVLLIIALLAAAVGAVRTVLGSGDPAETALSAFCSVLVVGIPVTGMLGFEVPLSRLSASLRRNGALLTGWNAVDKFGNTDAFAINTTDLFPRGSIRVRKSFAVNDMEIEEITSVAASVLVDAGGALGEVFSELIRDDARLRQQVDSITYETEFGITAWVKDKKVLVGNRNMMELHRVLIPGGGLARLDEFEAMRKSPNFQMLYVAVNNRLMGVYMLEYKAALSARKALIQLIGDGTGIMVYTCDANINVQLITSVFDIPPRFIAILDNEGSKVYDSVTFKVTQSEDALIATDGSLKALSAAIRAAVLLRDTEGVSLMIQGICFCMVMLFAIGLSCIGVFALEPVQLMTLQLVMLALSVVSILKSLR